MSPRKSRESFLKTHSPKLLLILFLLIAAFATTSAATASPDRIVYPVPYGVTASTDLSMKIHIEWYAQCDFAYADHFNIYAKGETDSYSMKVGETSYYGCVSGVPFEFDLYIDGIMDFPYEDYTIRIETAPPDGIGGSSDPSTPVVGSAIVSPPYISATDGTFDDRIEVSFYEFTFNSMLYKVYRSPTIDGDYNYVGYTYGDYEPELNGTYIDKNVSTGTGYYYKGKICTIDDECSELSETPAYGYVAASGPSGISATDGTEDRYITITWNEVDTPYYQLYRSLTNTEPDIAPYYAYVTTNHYNDYGADPYTTYYYWVRNYDGDIMGLTDASGPDTGWRPYEPAYNVTASKGTSSSSVDVTWDHDDEEIEFYLIYRAETNDGDKIIVGSSLTQTFSDTTALAGNTYYYHISGCDLMGRCSAVSGAALYNDGYRTMTDTTNIQATDGTSSAEVTVTWDPVYGATSYTIFRGTDPSVLLKTEIGTATTETFSDTTAVPGITYNYWVQGCSDEMCNGFSISNSGWRTMPFPGNVQATDGLVDNLTISWDDVSEASIFVVYRAESASDIPVAWSGSLTGTTTYNDPVATPGVTYYYWLKACNSYTCSVLSELDSGWQDLGVPSNVQATDGTMYPYIEVSWSGVANSTYNELYYGDSELDTPTLLSGNTGMPYQDSGVEPGETRGYWVRACNEYTCGDFSEFESGWRGIYDVTNIQATDGEYGKVTISWSPINFATYRVQRSVTLDGDKTLLDSITGSTYYEDTSATPGTTYYYWVNQCGPDVCSAFSSYDTGWRRGGDLPVVSSITLVDASPTNAASVEFLVTFSEDVTGVDVSDFVLTATVTSPTITNVTGTGSTRTVSVNTGSGSGTLRLDVVDDNTIQDDITNELGGSTIGDGDYSDGSVYTVDKGNPIVEEFTAHMPGTPTNDDALAFRVVFSETVLNVSVEDFELDTTSTAAITNITAMPASVYYVTVSGGDLADYNGFVGLNLSSQQDITDTAGNPLTQSEPVVDESFEVINATPVLSIERLSPLEEYVSVDQVTFLLSFSKEVMNVDETDFVVSGDSTASITAFTPYSQGQTDIYTATISGGDLSTFNGTLGLDLDPTQDISDTVGNVLPQEEPTVDETYTFDHVSPEVSLAGDALPGVTLTFITGPTEIMIEFSEEVLADGSENAANNPDNYLLFTAGRNGVYDTVSCAAEEAGTTGDDTFIPVGPALYDDNDGDGPFNVTLTLNDGTPLPIGEYKLFVCGTTSITDPSGNELNDGESDAYVILDIIEPEELPETGFAPSMVSVLPTQPIENSYDASYSLWLSITKIDTLASIVGVPAVDNEWDLTWLGTNVGYLLGTAYPTWSGNTALTGHVYTSDGYAGPFANLGSLAWGDKVRIYSTGLEYVYEVRTVDLYVDPSDLSVISDHNDYDWLTLITCNGYDSETDTYLWRTVVRAVLVEINHVN